MIGFEILLNNQPVCTVGIGQEGVLSAIITWAKRGAEIIAAEPTLSEEELGINVGGVVRDNDGNNLDCTLNWLDQDLQVGDEVTIKIVETTNFDEPASREYIEWGIR